MSFKRSTNVVLSNAGAADLVAGGMKLSGTVPQVLAQVSPVNGNNTTTLTGAVNMAQWKRVMVIGQVGDIDEVVDVAVQQSATSGGSYANIEAFEFAQIAGSDDDSQVVAIVSQADLGEGMTHIKGAITVGNGTTSLVSMVVIGLERDMAVDFDFLAGIELEFLPAALTSPATKLRFFTSDTTPTRDTVAGDFTWAALGGTGVAVRMSGPITLANGQFAVRDEVAVTAGASPTVEELQGWALLFGGELVASERFDSPKSIEVEGDFVSLDLTIPILTSIVPAY